MIGSIVFGAVLVAGAVTLGVKSFINKNKKQKKHTYGCVKDKEDSRDLKFKVSKPVAVPNNKDLTNSMTPIVDQGNLGSCTANGIASGFYECLRKEADIVEDSYPAFSRLYLYYKERELEGTIGEDSGAEIRDGMKLLQQNGVCKEKTWPYIIRKFTKKPPVSADEEAKNYKIISYYRVSNLNELKQAIASNLPVVVGIEVYESFESQDVANTGNVPMPADSEECLGGHCVVVVGYNDTTKIVKLRNSWGTSWGDKGYFYMSYDTFNKIVMDMWTGTLA